ncbi:armadillo-like helical domain-containing protein 2 isoform X2 [Ornithorhynchus anatinus]|uniref:Armadillo like helical domain containing 2 n=1 Tax=Ornithorhynchus anatinus TaxID=9258 RepID=A0A6I8NC70_ORNAN|nr:armadillo-like helical domain-containing protein 2 isoform X2 [Ornithorhynchus anatinus]
MAQRRDAIILKALRRGGDYVVELCYKIAAQVLALWEAYIQPYFVEKEEKFYTTVENIFHKEKINRFGKSLRDAELPVATKAEAVMKMGLLAYTGGPKGSKCALEYMPDMVALLQEPTLTAAEKIRLLKGLAGLCYIDSSSQNKAKKLHLVHILLDYLEPDGDSLSSDTGLHSTSLVKFWTCYLMSVITCNNHHSIKILKNIPGLKQKLKFLASQNWSGWPENYAEVLYFLVGFHKN